MITGAVFGALIAGGIALVFTVGIEDSLWEVVFVALGAAMLGAGVFGGASAIGEHTSKPCPESTVKADPNNGLYTGCVPVEVAKEQAESHV